MVTFDREYLQEQAKSKGLENLSTGVMIDPTLLFPSVETANVKYSSGTFYKFSASPTSFDLDPIFFFSKNDYRLIGKNNNDAVDFNPQKDPPKKSAQIMITKGPMYLSGWGYDICGLPVPASGGIDNSRLFDPNTPINRAIWKTGPIDLRWDDDRKVWTGGPEVLEGVLVTALQPGSIDSPTSATGVVYRGRDLKYKTFNIPENSGGTSKPDPYGRAASSSEIKTDVSEYITIYNRNSTLSLGSGSYFSAIKINYEWRVLGGGGAGNCIIGIYRKRNCSDPSMQNTQLPEFSITKNDNTDPPRYQINFKDIGKRKVFYLKTDNLLLKDLIPSDSAGGSLVGADGIEDITETKTIDDNTIRVPYSGYISMVAFNNCERSSDVFTYYFYGSGYEETGTGLYELKNTKSLYKVFDCPDSTDNFGFVTDDNGGGEYAALHPFKYIKNGVRVMACGSTATVICDGQKYNAHLITEVDDCNNSGTGLSLE